ncbi:MAG TPA: hypothetical protein VGK63_06685 [Candidatus Limnocylindrales bacterium]
MTEVRARDGATDLSERLDRLIAAADSLATTIARTERIAARAADVATLRPDRAAGLAAAGHGGGDRAGAGHAGDRLVPLAEVARRTGRHPDLLRRWCLDGRLDGVRVGRAWCLPERRIGQLAGFQRRRGR